MKTSVIQFEMMVTYMEQHGDFHKLSGNAQEKVQCIQHWATLTDLLNSIGSGETKPTEKWKKVWSDLKNNTKRKAARIHRASIGTGGGTPLQAKLTDLEQRVLSITGANSATSLEGVSEASIPQVIVDEETADSPPLHMFSTLEQPPITQSQVSSPALITDDVVCNEDWNQPAPATPTHVMPPPHDSPSWPAVAGHTPCSRVLPTYNRRSRRRRVRQSLSFLHCDTEWRQFKMERQKQHDENEKERLRLRALQLEMHSLMQDRWQLLTERMINVLNKIVDSKLCK